MGGGLCNGAGTGTGGTASSLSLSSCLTASRLVDAGTNPAAGGSIPRRMPPIPANLAVIRCFRAAASSSSSFRGPSSALSPSSTSSGGIDVGGGAAGRGGRESGFIGGGAPPNRIPPNLAMRSAIARRLADSSSSGTSGRGVVFSDVASSATCASSRRSQGQKQEPHTRGLHAHLCCPLRALLVPVPV